MVCRWWFRKKDTMHWNKVLLPIENVNIAPEKAGLFIRDRRCFGFACNTSDTEKDKLFEMH